MPTRFVPLAILTEEYEEDLFHSEALYFPEITRFHTQRDTAVFNARLNAAETLRNVEPNEIHTRIVPESVEIREFEIEIEPPNRNSAWRSPVVLRIRAVCATREDGYLTAFVPTLKVAVITRRAAEFDEKIRTEIISALRREGWTKSLEYLRRLERIRAVTLDFEELPVEIPTAKQRAIAEMNDVEDEESVLESATDDVASIEFAPVFETDENIARLASFFGSNEGTSVLLVGKPGVGKSSVFREMVRRREEFGLGGREFRETTGARLIAGQTGFGMWQERAAGLIREAAMRNAVVHLGNLVEILEVGKSNSSSQGIASFLRPKIARGEFVAVAECTPEQISFIERRDPNLLNAFQQVSIEEPDEPASLRILGAVFDAAVETRTQRDEVIAATDALHRRFSTYSAFPGRPVRFLRNLLRENDEAGVAVGDVFRAFSNETGIPEFLLSDTVPLDLAATEEYFSNRVMGQPEAVKLVTSVIATVKAKLTQPRKPIASLLMIGPTGVGKTEITKTLADFFFSTKERLVRFDMSEFSNELAVQRLIGGTGETEGLLTSKVREQPFSVVLFDEFEKADKSFFDLLLQVLGDGRLTDSAGRVADFTNAIVVMTSNLGASEFQRGDSGFKRRSREKSVAARHFERAVKNFLRPEIYNRIDRILPFSPLGVESVHRIARLEIEKLMKRDGIHQRGVGLEITDAAISLLADGGYDVRYGARPLKRAIERQLLAPLSAELARHSKDDAINVRVGTRNNALDLNFEVQAQKEKRGVDSAGRIVQNLADLRRRAQKLFANYRLTTLRDEIFQISKLEARSARGKWMSDAEKARIARKSTVEDYLARIAAFEEEVFGIEDVALLSLYGNSASAKEIEPEALACDRKFARLLIDLIRLESERPDEVTLALFGDHPHSLFQLADIYSGHTASLGGEITKAAFLTTKRPENAETPVFDLLGRKVHLSEPKSTPKTFSGARGDVVGILVSIACDAARARFSGENGLHHFSRAQNPGRVFVMQTDAVFGEFVPPETLERHDSIKLQPPRRTYDFVNMRVKDAVLVETVPLVGERLAGIVAEAIELKLLEMADEILA